MREHEALREEGCDRCREGNKRKQGFPPPEPLPAYQAPWDHHRPGFHPRLPLPVDYVPCVIDPFMRRKAIIGVGLMPNILPFFLLTVIRTPSHWGPLKATIIVDPIVYGCCGCCGGLVCPPPSEAPGGGGCVVGLEGLLYNKRGDLPK